MTIRRPEQHPLICIILDERKEPSSHFGEVAVQLLAENDDFNFNSAGVLTMKVPPGTPLLEAAGGLLNPLV